MKAALDLNADIGEIEGETAKVRDHAIMSHVSSVNIACGGHAGSAKIMTERCEKAVELGLSIGAHPAFPDRDNFGRKSWRLGVDIKAVTLSKSLIEQIRQLEHIAENAGGSLSYVKPHGALYNDSAKNPKLAAIIIGALKNINPKLALMGPPIGELKKQAERCEIDYICEGFIDRAYMDDGQLVPRGQTGALITAPQDQCRQLLQIAMDKKVTTINDNIIKLNVQSICLHGDSDGADQSAKMARHTLERHGIIICAALSTAL